MESKNKIAAWSSYWSEGNFTSLPNLYAANYDGAVLEFWAGIFRELKEHARLLDICTGNGAIAMLVRDNLDRREMVCDIHAIDVAEIHPIEVQHHGSVQNNVQFHPGTAVEATRFPDEYFDLIVGQFALEYCDLPLAIEELSRIIRNDGRIVLMMHHEDSVTVSKTIDLIRIADFFFENPSIFLRLRKYGEQYSRQKTPDTAKVAQTRKQLSASLGRAEELLKQYPKDRFLRATLGEIRQVIERIHERAPGQAASVRHFENIVRNYLIRMRDQRDAALNAQDMSELDELFLQHGFHDISYEPFYSEGLLFAWTLLAGKRGSVHDAEHQP